MHPPDDRIGARSGEPGLEMSTNRLESFSDGVFAVAITLLVLEPRSSRTWRRIVHSATRSSSNWPQYAAYVVSFLTIGIIWINHHAMIGRLRAADHTILILNLLLLMTVAVLPFATDLIATYLRHPHGRTLAAVLLRGRVPADGRACSGCSTASSCCGAQDLLRDSLPLARRRQIFVRAASRDPPVSRRGRRRVRLGLRLAGHLRRDRGVLRAPDRQRLRVGRRLTRRRHHRRSGDRARVSDSYVSGRRVVRNGNSSRRWRR